MTPDKITLFLGYPVQVFVKDRFSPVKGYLHGVDSKIITLHKTLSNEYITLNIINSIELDEHRFALDCIFQQEMYR